MVVESHAKHAGGGPRYWAQLSKGLIQRGHEVAILSGFPPDGQFASPNTIGLLPVNADLRRRSFSTLMRRYAFRRRFVPLVREYARDWNPDIIHTVPPIASKAAIETGKTLRVPVVASILSHVEAQWFRLESGRVRARLFRFIESRAHQAGFSRIICLTHRSEEVLMAEGVPRKRIAYVPHAVDITRFHSDVEPRFRQQLHLPKNAFAIGYAGALVREKGFEELLKAMQHFASERDLHLLVAGEIPEQLASDRKILRQVHFLGQLDHEEMPAFMTSLDLYVIPSFTETLPTTLLEALASGTPVMASSVGGIGDFLQNDWGITLESPENECIVESLKTWQERRSELKRMGEKGQQYVREHHNWERTSELTEGVYQSCLMNL